MRNKTTFLLAGILIVAAVIYLVVTSTTSTAQYFLTVNELSEKGDEIIGRKVTVSGAVIGETIIYDAMGPLVTFTIAHVPGDPDEIEIAGGLARVLHDAIDNPDLQRLEIVYDSVKPDLLQNEAQAIVRGQLNEDGRFYADELLLKCPTRYEEEIPEQIEG